MKRIRITILADLTETQARRAYPEIQDKMLTAMDAVFKNQSAEHIRIRVAGFEEKPLMIDASSSVFRELKRARRKAA